MQSVFSIALASYGQTTQRMTSVDPSGGFLLLLLPLLPSLYAKHNVTDFLVGYHQIGCVKDVTAATCIRQVKRLGHFAIRKLDALISYPATGPYRVSHQRSNTT